MAFFALLAASGCSGDGKKSVSTGESDPPPVDTCGDVVSDDDCDTTQRPIIFVHGTFGSGDNIAHTAMLFGSNGYCQDRFLAVEYNSIGGNPLDQLDALIDEVRERTGAEQVDLMGHSQGTMHCTSYLADETHAAKVAHYVNLSGANEVPNGVPTLSISSNNDLGGRPHHAPNAEKTVTFETEDHVDVASSPASFVEIYKYLIGREPDYTEVQCGDEEITLEGIAETFGDNVPVASGNIEVYELGRSPWERDEPVMVLTSDAMGHTESFKLKRLVAYEFRATDGNGNLMGHVYFAPFKRSNRLLRFLSPSSNVLVSGLSTDNLVRGPNHVALVARNIRGSFRHDQGQVLEMNGSDVLTDDNAGVSLATVGLFMADQNLNGQSDLGAAFSAPFVVGTDVYLDARTPAWVDINWNGTPLRIPNWPSSEGLISILLP